MKAVGIDVSNGKSTVAIMQPFGDVVTELSEIFHTGTELRKLHESGIFIFVVNALPVCKYGNNSIRKSKVDRLDAVKITKYRPDR